MRARGSGKFLTHIVIVTSVATQLFLDFLGQTVKRMYCKIPKISDTRILAVITLKVEQDGFILE